jgi:hypothetical protein
MVYKDGVEIDQETFTQRVIQYLIDLVNIAGIGKIKEDLKQGGYSFEDSELLVAIAASSAEIKIMDVNSIYVLPIKNVRRPSHPNHRGLLPDDPGRNVGPLEG